MIVKKARAEDSKTQILMTVRMCVFSIDTTADVSKEDVTLTLSSFWSFSAQGGGGGGGIVFGTAHVNCNKAGT